MVTESSGAILTSSPYAVPQHLEQAVLVDRRGADVPEALELGRSKTTSIRIVGERLGGEAR